MIGIMTNFSLCLCFICCLCLHQIQRVSTAFLAKYLFIDLFSVIYLLTLGGL